MNQYLQQFNVMIAEASDYLADQLHYAPSSVGQRSFCAGRIHYNCIAMVVDDETVFV